MIFYYIEDVDTVSILKHSLHCDEQDIYVSQGIGVRQQCSWFKASCYNTQRKLTFVFKDTNRWDTKMIRDTYQTSEQIIIKLRYTGRLRRNPRLTYSQFIGNHSVRIAVTRSQSSDPPVPNGIFQDSETHFEYLFWTDRCCIFSHFYILNI